MEYLNFKTALLNEQNEGLVCVLYRGINCEMIESFFKMKSCNNLLVEKIFLWGTKSKSVWNEYLTQGKFSTEFKINDISVEFFEFIFNQLNKILNDKLKDKLINALFMKEETACFFMDARNKQKFICLINKQPTDNLLEIRNYYLKILHQIGNEQNSFFVSTTSSKRVAKKFANKGVVLETWVINYSKQECLKKLPTFKRKPYPKQKEVSIYGAIFPDYILSIDLNGTVYNNPALEYTTNITNTIFNGFDVDYSKRDSDINIDSLIVEDNGVVKSVSINKYLQG